jgi:hypothetical protein
MLDCRPSRYGAWAQIVLKGAVTRVQLLVLDTLHLFGEIARDHSANSVDADSMSAITSFCIFPKLLVLTSCGQPRHDLCVRFAEIGSQLP